MTYPKNNTADHAKPAEKLHQVPTADDCSKCGLSYCDCEVCDDKGTVQVPPAETE